MREMKDSGIAWIGVIPQDWEIVRTKSLYCSAKEIAGDRADDFERLALTLNGVIKRSKEDSVGLQPEKFSGYQILKKGELVFKLIDLENVATSRVGLSPYTGIVSPAYIVLSKQSRAKDLVVRYSMYHFLSMWQREIFNQMGDNGVRSSLNTKELLNIPHPFPSICEQKRIVTFLDAQCAEIDAVLEKTRASIEEYKKLKQAVITQAVTKGIRGDRPMKNSGIEWIGEIANEFAVYKFKYLLKTPMQYGANEAGITFDKTLPRYIRITDITSDGRLKQDNRLCIEDTVAKPYILQDGDLLFARSGGTVGKSFLYKQSYGNAAFAGYLIRAVVNRTIAVPEYVYYYTNSSIYDTWKNSIFIQSTIQNIGADRYSNMPIIVPNNIEEQRSIVEYLNERCVGIDALIRKKQQYLTEIENYKKSLIYEYVTGKKEVKTSVLAD